MVTSELVEVQTEYGPIQGCTRDSCLGKRYYNFQRIPYMKPPVGKLRFRDPEPPEAWTEKLDCTEESEAFCNMNFLSGQYEGKLDAVNINVYTNEIKPKNAYPVMVWVIPHILID
jgi:carboxylesterase type B